MKGFGHTKTLFIQGGKYKWSFKYEHCIDCGLVKFKHKGRGLCTSCWEKERDKTERRKEVKQKAGHKWHVINKPRKPREEWKLMGPKPTGFDKKAYLKEWYQKWKEAIILLNKGKIWQSKGMILPQFMGKPIPFDIGPRNDKIESYEDYKERCRKFDVIKKYLLK